LSLIFRSQLSSLIWGHDWNLNKEIDEFSNSDKAAVTHCRD
jgi:hypothetical protein